jgi:hypothetical protein
MTLMRSATFRKFIPVVVKYRNIELNACHLSSEKA